MRQNTNAFNAAVTKYRYLQKRMHCSELYACMHVTLTIHWQFCYYIVTVRQVSDIISIS